MFWAHRLGNRYSPLKLWTQQEGQYRETLEPDSASARPEIWGEGSDFLRFMNAKLGSLRTLKCPWKHCGKFQGSQTTFLALAFRIHTHIYFFLFYHNSLNKRNTLPCLPDLQIGDIHRWGVPGSYILAKPRPRHAFVKQGPFIVSLSLLERNSGQYISVIM